MQLPRVVTIGEARMKVMIETQNSGKSAYLEAGAPTECFLPDCGKPFLKSCLHG